MVDKTTQLLLKTFGVLLKAIRRTKAQKQDDKAKALRGRMASPRIQERISMVDLARLAGEVYTDLRDPSTTPQGFGRALREGKQDLESAQDVSIDRRVANLADKREGEATKRDRKKSARLQAVRRRNDEPPTPVNAFLKAFGVMKAPTSEENAAKFNRMVEAANERKAKRFANERQIAPDFVNDDTINYSVSDETHQYDSDEALRSKPAMKRVQAGMKRRGRSEADIKDYTDALIERDKLDQSQRTRDSLDTHYPKSYGRTSIQNFLKAFGVMKARSAANRAKNKRARGLRRTKAESRKLDALSQRTKAVEERRGRSSMEYTNPFSGESLSFADRTSAQAHRASMRPADTAISIATRNAERERQGKRPIKSPYGESFIATSETTNFSKPETWTPEQQRLVTDSEKARQRTIARSGEQEEAQEARQQRWNRRQGKGLA